LGISAPRIYCSILGCTVHARGKHEKQVAGLAAAYQSNPSKREFCYRQLKDLCFHIGDISWYYDLEYNTPAAWFAIHLGLVEVFKELLRADPDLTLTVFRGEYALHEVLDAGDDRPANLLVHLLVESGADIEARNEKGKTALYIATERGDIGIAKFLLDNGASVDAEWTDPKTSIVKTPFFAGSAIPSDGDILFISIELCGPCGSHVLWCGSFSLLSLDLQYSRFRNTVVCKKVEKTEKQKPQLKFL
jgi:hypothetical protein